jgi:LEA14-like dessication related protein
MHRGKMEAETIYTICLTGMVLILLLLYVEQPVNSPTSSSQVISDIKVIGIRSASFSGVVLKVQFTAKNPTPISFVLERATYLLYGDGNYLGRGVISEQIAIPAHNSTIVDSSFSTGLLDASQVFLSYATSGSSQISWEARGNATFVEPLLGTLTVPFECTSSSS